ncbi:MAG: MBL fold metallo-hydrolase [Candidatus Baldrarchaeia archaeon]
MVVRIARDVYAIGGPELSHFSDAYIYLIVASPAILIDAGTGKGARKVFSNMKKAGVDPRSVGYLVNTHAHYDHVGGNKVTREKCGCKVLIHELDADVVERGDVMRSAANYYGDVLEPCPVDVKLKTRGSEVIKLGSVGLEILHIPGHTPGSIAIYYKSVDGKRMLFGGDLHGPFSSAWGSNISEWRKSINRILQLEIDILCEGHSIVTRDPKGWIEDLLSYWGEW